MRFENTPGNGLRAIGVTLKTLIEVSYDVQDFQISGGPGWLRTDRYDIVAKPERPEGPADLRNASDAEQKSQADRWCERIRALLAERFQLTVHRETGERPVYALVQAKGGHKLAESTDGNGITRNRGLITGDAATLPILARVLSTTIGRPVLDQTGMTGKYQFRLEWTEDSAGIKGKGTEMDVAAGPADPSGQSIFSAIQQQLGLKLEPQKAPVDIIVIDRAEKPTAN